jgi:hypothetical protein
MQYGLSVFLMTHATVITLTVYRRLYMKKFKQVETRLVTTTYHVSAKDVNEASSFIENGDDSVETVDDTIDVQVDIECEEVKDE